MRRPTTAMVNSRHPINHLAQSDQEEEEAYSRCPNDQSTTVSATKNKGSSWPI